MVQPRGRGPLVIRRPIGCSGPGWSAEWASRPLTWFSGRTSARDVALVSWIGLPKSTPTQTWLTIVARSSCALPKATGPPPRSHGSPATRSRCTGWYEQPWCKRRRPNAAVLVAQHRHLDSSPPARQMGRTPHHGWPSPSLGPLSTSPATQRPGRSARTPLAGWIARPKRTLAPPPVRGFSPLDQQRRHTTVLDLWPNVYPRAVQGACETGYQGMGQGELSRLAPREHRPPIVRTRVGRCLRVRRKPGPSSSARTLRHPHSKNRPPFSEGRAVPLGITAA